jgi:hypothetical protein
MTVEAPIAPPPVTRARHGRHSRPVRRLPTWITVVLWIVVGALALVAGVRLFAWDDLEPFAVLNDVTAFVYLPAWIVAVVAIVGRRPFLAGAALLVVMAQIAFLAPELAAALPTPAWAGRAPTLRLLDANVYNVNPSMAGYAGEIEALHPDLVTMGEATPTDVGQLERDGALAGLPNRVEIERYDPTAFLVASRYPLTGANVFYLYGRPLVVQVTGTCPRDPFPCGWSTPSPRCPARSRSGRGSLPSSTGPCGPAARPGCSWSATSTPPGGPRGSGSCSTPA